MSATTFLRRRDYAGDTCKNEEFPAATFGKTVCIFRYLGVAKNTKGYVLLFSTGEMFCELYGYSIFAPFFLLHLQQRVLKLSSDVNPPFETGTI